jgi:hypothetical protein
MRANIEIEDSQQLAFPIRQAFRLLGVNVNRGYRYIAEGRLLTYKHGKRRFATRRAIENCLTALEREAEQGATKKRAK